MPISTRSKDAGLTTSVLLPGPTGFGHDRDNPLPTRDINAQIAFLLRDLAFAQDSEQRMFGYKRAASAVLALEQSLADQRREIDRLNAASKGRFCLIHGIEANIATDGRLDLSAAEAGEFELVLAAPHSKLRKTDDQTSRMVAAVRHPSLHILAHPRGRISGSRGGVVADWDVVFAAAAQRRVAIEIDGDPSRQDLDYSLAERALAAGCLFALDSDAHTTNQLQYSETALAHAMLAGIPPARIVNCWDWPALADWIAQQHSR